MYIHLISSYLFIDELFVLVYWPEEDCVSVVAGTRVTGNQHIGTKCKVSIQNKHYTGQVAATGKCACRGCTLAW